MKDRWASFLSQAHDEAADVQRPAPDVLTALDQAKSGAFQCDLSNYALCSFTGVDAEAFLHGQLSNDIKALTDGHCQLAAYNTPKGRMLATLLLWRIEEGFLAQMPGSIAASVIKRLSMFVLRSKLKVSDVSDRYVRFGIGGPQAASILESCSIDIPTGDYGLSRPARRAGPDQVLRLPGERYELVYSDVEAAISDWERTGRAAMITDPTPWRWLAVRNGIADIERETQDKYVPQMLNLELIGGVSFTKGCYPGQEIVARAQYRGEIKRRMFLAHVDAATSPLLAQDVCATSSSPPQVVGSVAAHAPAPGGGHEVLACLHVDLAHNAELRLGGADGPRLQLLDLPYKLPLNA